MPEETQTNQSNPQGAGSTPPNVVVSPEKKSSGLVWKVITALVVLAIIISRHQRYNKTNSSC